MLELLAPVMDYLIIAVVTAFAWFANNKYQQNKGRQDVKDEQNEEQLESVREARKLSERVASMPRNDVIKRLLERKTK